MSVNIQDLLSTLFQNLADQNLSEQTKINVTLGHKHFMTLQNSTDRPQARMISTFLGTLIYTIRSDGWALDETKEFIGFYQSSTAATYEVTGNLVLAALSDPQKRDSLTCLFIGIIYSNDKKLQDEIKYLVEFCALNPENLEKPTFTPSNYQKEVEKTNNLSMAVLGGFIMALGITAIAIAFTIMMFSTMGAGIALAARTAAVLAGCGIFSLRDKKCPSLSECFGIDDPVEEGSLKLA